jgi:hypothetical protein
MLCYAAPRYLKIFLKKELFFVLFFSPQLLAKAVSRSFCWAEMPDPLQEQVTSWRI